jgi:hypothetical protein
MASIRVRVGRASEILHDEHRLDVESFVRQLQNDGLDVDLEVVQFVRGRRGVTWVEWLTIFVGSGVGSALVNNVSNDLYDAARAWARRRLRKKRDQNGSAGARPIGFVIYGPNGEELRRWDTREDEEDDGTTQQS